MRRGHMPPGLTGPLTVTLVGTPEEFEKAFMAGLGPPPSKARATAAVEMHELMDRDPSLERRTLIRYGRTRLDPRTVFRLAGAQTTSTSFADRPVGAGRAPRGRRAGHSRSRSPRPADDDPSPPPDLSPSWLRRVLGPPRCRWDAHIWPSRVWQRLAREADIAARQDA